MDKQTVRVEIPYLSNKLGLTHFVRETMENSVNRCMISHEQVCVLVARDRTKATVSKVASYVCTTNQFGCLNKP